MAYYVSNIKDHNIQYYIHNFTEEEYKVISDITQENVKKKDALLSERFDIINNKIVIYLEECKFHTKYTIEKILLLSEIDENIKNLPTCTTPNGNIGLCTFIPYEYYGSSYIRRFEQKKSCFTPLNMIYSKCDVIYVMSCELY